MKKATVTVSFEQEKLKAVQFYAGKNGTSLELEQPRPRPARSPRSAAPDTFDEKKGVE